jgi:hypothetical protein
VVEVDALRESMHLPPAAPNPPLYFKPTCVGLSTSRRISLRNPVRIPVLFSVDVPPSAARVFTITPRNGLLRGNQSISLSLAFAPLKQKEYGFRVSLLRARTRVMVFF